ncbi:hypothetical protein KAREA_42480 [Prescottella equi]|nr:hypothetical protein KAREA_42480 [Prescottella equi]
MLQPKDTVETTRSVPGRVVYCMCVDIELLTLALGWAGELPDFGDYAERAVARESEFRCAVSPG